MMNIKSFFTNNTLNTHGNNANQSTSVGSKADSMSSNADDVNERVKAFARESFDSMNAASAKGDSIFLEKCYVIIGGKESEQLLQLRCLQHMIQMEQEVWKKSLFCYFHNYPSLPQFFNSV